MTVVLLDRDGVISENRPDHVKSWEEFRFLPGALEGLAALCERAGRQAEAAELKERAALLSSVPEPGGTTRGRERRA